MFSAAALRLVGTKSVDATEAALAGSVAGHDAGMPDAFGVSLPPLLAIRWLDAPTAD